MTTDDQAVKQLLEAFHEQRIDRRALLTGLVALGAGLRLGGVSAQDGSDVEIVEGDPGEAVKFAETALRSNKYAMEIAEEFTKRGLTGQPERAQMFRTESPREDGAAIAIVPFTTEKLTAEASISLSDNTFALGVFVAMRDPSTIESFEIVVIEESGLRSEVISLDQVESGKAGLRLKPHHDTEIELISISMIQAGDMAMRSFEALLQDEASMAVHSEEELVALRGYMPAVGDLAGIVQTQVAAGACCSTSCFGCTSCSSFTINTGKKSND